MSGPTSATEPHDPHEQRETHGQSGRPVLAVPPGAPPRWVPRDPSSFAETGRTDPLGGGLTVAGGRRAAAVPATSAAESETEHEAAELADVARERSGAAAAAYTAANGHASRHSGAEELGEHGARRWAPSLRGALVAGLVVLVLAVATGAVALLRSSGDGQVETLADLSAASAVGASSGTADSEEEPATGDRTGDEQLDPPVVTGDAPDVSAAGSPTGGPSAQGSPGAVVVVHVVGEVESAGVVVLAEGSRVADALAEAGGATSHADLSAVNLARVVTDGEQVYVPRPGEEPPVPVAQGAAPAAGPTGGAGTGTAGGSVDLNTADATALQALPGVGPVLSERIVQWRTDNGPFTSVEELGEVSGIGPAILDRLRDLARV